MSELSQKDKKNIANVIKGLYGGAVHASADQITEEVETIVDRMIAEIAQCSSRVELALTAYEIFYQNLPVKVIANKILQMAVDQYVSSWIGEIKKNFSAKACTNVTLANWRSPLEMALMGI